MTRMEALQAIKQGKKVTHSILDDDEFLTLSKCGDFIIDETGEEVASITDPVINEVQSDCTDNNWKEAA